MNQAPDLVTFRAEGARERCGPDFCAWLDGADFPGRRRRGFTGAWSQVPGRATAQAEDQLYRVAGPWWYLENLVFQQTWQMTNGTTYDADRDEQEPVDPGPEGGRDEAGDGRGDRGSAGLCDGAGRADHGGRRLRRMRSRPTRRRWTSRARR